VVLAYRLDDELREVPLLTHEELALRDELVAGRLTGPDARRTARELLRLKRERQEARAWYLQRGARHPARVVVAAAMRVERAAQEAFWRFGGVESFVRLRDARILWDAQYQAHEAVVARLSRRQAKEIQREAAGDRDPLTVCVGKRLRRLPQRVLAKHAPDLLEHYKENIVPLGAGDGCGVIFVDTLAERTPKMYCERCRKQAGNTMNAGKAKNARARLRKARRR